MPVLRQKILFSPLFFLSSFSKGETGGWAPAFSLAYKRSTLAVAKKQSAVALFLEKRRREKIA